MMFDAGTNNEELLEDPYVGLRCFAMLCIDHVPALYMTWCTHGILQDMQLIALLFLAATTWAYNTGDWRVNSTLNCWMSS